MTTSPATNPYSLAQQYPSIAGADPNYALAARGLAPLASDADYTACTNYASPLSVATPLSALPSPSNATVGAASFYKDLNIAFSQPQTVAQLVVTNVNAINSQIEHVFTTSYQTQNQFGERWWEPTFGSALPNMVFEPCDPITAHDMETRVFMAFDAWLPHVRLDKTASYITALPEQALFDFNLSYSFITPDGRVLDGKARIYYNKL